MKLRKHAEKQPTSAETNAKDQPISKEKNEPISCCDKQTDQHCEREENAEDKTKTTPRREDSDEEPISWSDLEKSTVYALLAFFCIALVIGFTLIVMLYRERLGVSTEFEKYFMDFIAETWFI